MTDRIDLSDPKTWGAATESTTGLSAITDEIGRGLDELAAGKVVPSPATLEGKFFVLRYDDSGVTRLLHLEPGTKETETISGVEIVHYHPVEPLTGETWDFLAGDMKSFLESGELTAIPDNLVPLFIGCARTYAADRVRQFVDTLDAEAGN